MTDADFAVVGAGLAGASTARALADRGHRVVVLERAVPANPRGSSHGSARIFRYAYPDAFYTRLVGAARAGWDELEAACGASLVRRTGALDFGAVRDPHGLARVLAACGVEHELLSPAAAAERWPGIRFDADVLWHPAAGVLDAQSTVLALLELARAGGAVVQSGWTVRSIERRHDGYVLTSGTGQAVVASKVVLTAGGWLPDLLDGLPARALVEQLPPFTVRQEQVFHYPYLNPRPDATSWPTFVHKSDTMRSYGLPGGRDAGFRGHKVAEFNGGSPLRSASLSDGVVDPANRRRVTEWVRENLPGLVPEPYAEATCLFTSTPSEDFVIDSADGITVVSPCSGHGAKFAPLIGQWAADAATWAPSVPARFRVRPAVPA